MENLIKIRKTFSKAMLLVYALVSIVACAVCMMLSHSDKAHVGIVMLVGFSILWVFTTISSICYFRQLDKTPAGLARYYMIHTLARFIVGGLIMLLLSSLANAEYKLILIGFWWKNSGNKVMKSFFMCRRDFTSAWIIMSQ